MPAFEHACFISYKHPPEAEEAIAVKHHWMEFVETFHAKLQGYVTLGLSVYRDDMLRRKPGVKYPEELSGRLCKSVCMIAVLVPEYLESSWCRAEWKAMEELEGIRSVKDKSDGLIFPVLFRGDLAKAATFAAGRDVLDFRHVYRPPIQLNTIKSRKTLEDMAQRIQYFSQQLECKPCDKFRIEAGPETVVLTFDDPNPIAQQ